MCTEALVFETWSKKKEITHVQIVIESLSGQRCFCATLKAYLASRNKTYKNSHPCDRNPWLFCIQMFKVLMQQSPVLKTGNLRQLGAEGQSTQATQHYSRLCISPPEHCMHPRTGFYH